ncbi:tumor necrosis factor receptor superfamily member 10B-like isoform X5 [Choloepus didactylus]|uniref:tumor necrosis factor receptor superfamily member 10B-like isoform X5 n=1 Tax=Choloepus didactylus TaxID=27675 RepID=UPI00189DBACE|nr:tumor necrosis factor receptor superfamily member 10B-like isoform X5 [Choloepus didactylus]
MEVNRSGKSSFSLFGFPDNLEGSLPPPPPHPPPLGPCEDHSPAFLSIPGSHVSDAGGNCTLCRSGVEYTSHWNALFSCLRCSVCKSDEEEMSPCTRTRDAQCRCKPGTFRGEDALEFCQKCKTGCPKGMVEAHPCTPWGDVECVHQGSGTETTGEATVSEEPVDSGLGSPASTSSGCGEDSKCLARVSCLSPPGGSQPLNISCPPLPSSVHLPGVSGGDCKRQRV